MSPASAATSPARAIATACQSHCRVRTWANAAIKVNEKLPASKDVRIMMRRMYGVLLSFALQRATNYAFFDQVLVNDPDERVRANRLRLLRDAAALARQRFDVAALGGGR